MQLISDLKNNTNNSLPTVGIVVVSWNKKDYLLKLLDAILQLRYPNYNVVVVDNASNDGSTECVRSLFPSVTLLVNETNIGGTGGFNTGIEFCINEKYDYIWLLDNDALIEQDSLDHLVNAATSDRTIGVVGSKILNSENPSFVVKLGARIDWSVGLVRSICQNMRDRQEYATGLIDADYIPFCSALISRECFLVTGRLDERFFLYWDDSDFCVRASKAGFRTVVALDSKVFHPSFTEKSRNQNYYLIRNTLLFFSKHLNGVSYATNQFRVIGRFFKEMMFAHLTNDLHRSSVIRLGVKDFLFGRFGKMRCCLPVQEKCVGAKEVSLNEIKGSRLLVTHEGSAEVIRKIVDFAYANGAESVVVLIPFSRVELVSNQNARLLILDDRCSNLFIEHVKIFYCVFKKNFDAIIMSHATSPFAFAGRRAYAYDASQNICRKVPLSRTRIPLLVLSISLSYLLLSVLLPFILCRGLIAGRTRSAASNPS